MYIQRAIVGSMILLACSAAFALTPCPVTVLKSNLYSSECETLDYLKADKIWTEVFKYELNASLMKEDLKQKNTQKVSSDIILAGEIDPTADNIDFFIDKLEEGGEALFGWMDKDGNSDQTAYIKMTEEFIKKYPNYNFTLMAKTFSPNKGRNQQKTYLLAVVNTYTDWLGKFFINDDNLSQFNYKIDYLQSDYKTLELYYGGTDYKEGKGYFSNDFYPKKSKYIIASDDLLADKKWREKINKDLSARISFRGALSKITDNPVANHVFAEIKFTGTDEYTEIKNTLNKALSMIKPDLADIVDEKKKELNEICDVRIYWKGIQKPEVYKEYYNKLIKDIYGTDGALFRDKRFIGLPVLLTIEKKQHYLLIVSLIPYTDLSTEMYKIDPDSSLSDYKDKTVLCFGDGELIYGDKPVAEYLNAFLGSKAYSLDIVYTGLDEKDNLIRMRLNQSVSLPTSQFISDIKRLVPGAKDGVDFVLGEDLICCIACEEGFKEKDVVNPERYKDIPYFFDSVGVENTLLNTIGILKNGGKAKFVWTSHCSSDFNTSWERSYYEKIVNEVKKNKPDIDIKIDVKRTSTVYDGVKFKYLMTIHKK